MIFLPHTSRFCACLGIQVHVCASHHPQENGFVERYHRTYQEECLAVERPTTLEQAREVTEVFVEHYNVQRPNQALSCSNQPPRSAFPTLPALRPLPQIVDPDSWLDELHGWHVERKVDAHGTVRIDLKAYYISSKLVGQRLTLQLDAKAQCLHVFQGSQQLKSLPIKGLVGHLLTGCRSSWPICELKPAPRLACALCKNVACALLLSPRLSRALPARLLGYDVLTLCRSRGE